MRPISKTRNKLKPTPISLTLAQNTTPSNLRSSPPSSSPPARRSPPPTNTRLRLQAAIMGEAIPDSPDLSLSTCELDDSQVPLKGFWRLPPEIRNAIYEELLVTDCAFRLGYATTFHMQNPAATPAHMCAIPLTRVPIQAPRPLFA